MQFSTACFQEQARGRCVQEQIFHISGLKKAPQMGSNKKDSVTEKAVVWEEAAGKVCQAQS